MEPGNAHMLAGATAGIAEHVLLYPVDVIKTRAQALSHPGQQVRRSHVGCTEPAAWCAQQQELLTETGLGFNACAKHSCQPQAQSVDDPKCCPCCSCMADLSGAPWPLSCSVRASEACMAASLLQLLELGEFHLLYLSCQCSPLCPQEPGRLVYTLLHAEQHHT